MNGRKTCLTKRRNDVALRAIAYVSRGDLMMLRSAPGLRCQPSPVPNETPTLRRFLRVKERPCQLIITLILTNQTEACQLTIGAVMTRLHEPPSDESSHWERLPGRTQYEVSDIDVERMGSNESWRPAIPMLGDCQRSKLRVSLCPNKSTQIAAQRLIGSLCSSSTQDDQLLLRLPRKHAQHRHADRSADERPLLELPFGSTHALGHHWNLRQRFR